MTLDKQKEILTGKLRPFERLDRFISDIWSDRLSRTRVHKLIKEGNVIVSDKVITKPSFRSKEEIPLKVILPKEDPELIFAKNLRIPTLYEDRYLAVIHKPPKVTVHPGAGWHQDTLVHSLIAQFKNLSDINTDQRPGIVHRLDRDTEGLMLIAKNNQTHHLLSDQFKNREVYKEYHAWFQGVPKFHEFELKGYVSRNPRNRKLMQFSKEPLSGRAKYSILSYKLVKKIKGYSLLRVIPETGRTHQIRCSFASIHLYILYDILYGPNSFKRDDRYHHFGLLLLANRLRFLHPISKKELEFSIDFPKRFLEFEEQTSSLL